jgi:signal peptidase I
MRTHRETRRTLPRWLDWIGQGVSFLFLCVAGLAAVVLIIVPIATGSQTYSVLTSSMVPTYPPGTFLVVKPTEFDQLQTGDVVTYQVDSGRPDVITHRITAVTADQSGERLLVTQGDNNDVADDKPVMEVQVRGKLFYAVPYVGFLANALGQTDRSWLITALAVGLIGFGLVTMVASTVRSRRAKRRAAEAEDAAQDADTPENSAAGVGAPSGEPAEADADTPSSPRQSRS